MVRHLYGQGSRHLSNLALPREPKGRCGRPDATKAYPGHLLDTCDSPREWDRDLGLLTGACCAARQFPIMPSYLMYVRHPWRNRHISAQSVACFRSPNSQIHSTGDELMLSLDSELWHRSSASRFVDHDGSFHLPVIA